MMDDEDVVAVLVQETVAAMQAELSKAYVHYVKTSNR